MDHSILPIEIIELIVDYLIDSRPIYLTNRILLDRSNDRVYWESRENDRIKHHLVKMPTEIPFIRFIREGNLKMVRHLHKKGVDTTTNNNFAFRWASLNGHLGIVKYLNINTENSLSVISSAIQWAESNGHSEVVNYLLNCAN